MAGKREKSLAQQLFQFLPFEGWEVVEATFTTPNTDMKVGHSLNPDQPEDVGYIVLRTSGGPAIVYDEPTLVDGVAAIPWTKSYIVVRATSEVTVTFLLVLKRRAGSPNRI